MPHECGPAAAVQAAWAGRRVPAGPSEQFFGWGLMGQPFASGHVLALRCFPQSSVGPGYVAVWHRDPGGAWRFYSDAPAGQSCARYFGPELAAARRCAVVVHWATPWILVVEVPDIGLRWVSEFAETRRTRALNAVAARVPEAWFWSPTMLGGLGVLASRLLGLGNLRLAGIAPSGQWYLASPRRLWVVRDGGAELGGEDFGPARPLPRQPRLGQFWVPQHSVLAIGAARFERFDADRHRVPA